MTKEHLLKALKANCRYDGRKLNEFRPITVHYDSAQGAEGSCEVRIGATRMIVGVKMGLGTPYPDTPNKGNLMVNAELTPMSSSLFEPGPPGITAIELSRVVDRGIRESEAVNPQKLCIRPGEKVWSIMIDAVTVNADGNLIDAAALGALGALKKAVFPTITEAGTIDYMTRTKEQLPLDKEPVAITVFKVGDYLFVDPLAEEEAFAEARLTVTVTEKGQLCSLQKNGITPLTLEEVDKMTALAVELAPQLRKKL